MEQFSQNIIELLTTLSKNFGTGVLVNDLLLFLLLVAGVTLIIALAAYRHTYNLKTPPGLERVNAIGGKVEKVEMNLGEFRIETVRNLELFRGDLGYLKQELGEISRLLKRLAASNRFTATPSAPQGPEDFAPQHAAQEEALPSDPLNRQDPIFGLESRPPQKKN